MATKLTIPELNQAMRQVVYSNLKLTPCPLFNAEKLDKIVEVYRDKLQYYNQEFIDGSSINFLCGALAVTMVGNAKLQYAEQPENVSTLVLHTPTIVQVSKGKFQATALLLTLPKMEMDELVRTYSDNPQQQANSTMVV